MTGTETAAINLLKLKNQELRDLRDQRDTLLAAAEAADKWIWQGIGDATRAELPSDYRISDQLRAAIQQARGGTK